jgi:hypothetical protein
VAGAVEIRGLRELDRAFTQISRDVKRGIRKELRDAGAPVRSRAEQLAVAEIRNIGGRWSGMRIGVTSRTVYVAPRPRRSGGSPRPNLAGLLLNRAMQPALDEQRDEVIRRLESWIDRVAAKNGF